MCHISCHQKNLDLVVRIKCDYFLCERICTMSMCWNFTIQASATKRPKWNRHSLDKNLVQVLLTSLAGVMREQCSDNVNLKPKVI